MRCINSHGRPSISDNAPYSRAVCTRSICVLMIIECGVDVGLYACTRDADTLSATASLPLRRSDLCVSLSAAGPSPPFPGADAALAGAPAGGCHAWPPGRAGNALALASPALWPVRLASRCARGPLRFPLRQPNEISRQQQRQRYCSRSEVVLRDCRDHGPAAAVVLLSVAAATVVDSADTLSWNRLQHLWH